MNDNKSTVILWIKSGMDYTAGIDLLTKLTVRQNYSGIFRGKEQSMSDKLAYEICKAAKVADHITWKQFIQSAKAGALDTILAIHKELLDSDAPGTTVKSDEPWSELNPSGEYPPIIHRVMYESASVFQQRSKLHRLMVGMPDSNSAPLVSKRAELFGQVKALSERLELLVETKKAFIERGIIPEEQQLYPAEKPAENMAETVLMDEAALKKQKKNLQTSNSKDQSRLYDPSKKPMPASPKRMMLESRIKERLKLIEKIDYQLLNLSTQ